MKNRRAFITGIKSYKLNSSEKKFLKKFKPWGVILFSRNIKNIDQTKKLTESIKKIFNDNNYPILIDQEGGRVNRLNKIISFDTLTSEYFGNLFKKDKFKFNMIYKMFIDQTSHLLKLIGANINTVPVLDTRVKGSSNIIGDRAYSNNPKLISKLGDFCIKYFHRNSIGTIMKHIPGHGEAKVDSHYFTPIVKKKLSKLIKEDFSPFKNKKCFFAMTAHVVYKDIDKSNTATHSKQMIALIRNKIGFKNILISDDLSMKSLKKDLEYNTLKTFSSGCNIALHCNGNINEMVTVASNSPLVNKFIIQKTSEFYKILR